MKFKYRDTVLDELARHGIKPRDDTPPDLIREFINDLYLIEIRRLRTNLKSGLIQKADYAGEVDALRKRYPILSLPVRFWTEDSELRS
jgi:hypothetical protein